MNRRAFLGGSAAVLAGGASMFRRQSAIWSQEYWAAKGEVRLNLFRKRAAPPGAGEQLPVLFLAHGSSSSGRPQYDLTVPGHDDYSLMDTFARYGYDVWTMDFEGYGRSSRTAGNSDIKSGVADLEAAVQVLERETGRRRFHFFGQSSGSLRVAAFAAAAPDRVDRLVLAAFTYTGEGSPTLEDRAKQVEYYRRNNRRPRTRESLRSTFTRDEPGTSDPAVAEALADAELVFGDTVPSGTYLDMTANLPVVEPENVKCPVMIIRGEHDGIADEQDLLTFFKRLPNFDRQMIALPDTAHTIHLGHNRHQLWHAMRAFLEMPPGRGVSRTGSL